MLVSIVIDNYNYGRYLGACVESALAQTYEPLEVVVVDDGSTDDSREILARYASRTTVVLKENSGQGSALNAGFEASHGEVILFLDADDRLDPETAATVARHWQPDVAKVQYGLRMIDEEGNRLPGLVDGTIDPALEPREWLLRTGSSPSPSLSGTAYGRPALEAMLPMPPDPWRISADAYLSTLAPILGRVIALPDILGAYRIHPDNRWVPKEITGERLRSHLELDVKRFETLERFGADRGVAVPRDIDLRDARHLQWRLASLRWDPERHPIGSDRTWTLALRGVRATAGPMPRKALTRLLMAAWFLAMAVVPRRLARHLVRLRLLPRSRPRPLQWLIGGAG